MHSWTRLLTGKRIASPERVFFFPNSWFRLSIRLRWKQEGGKLYDAVKDVMDETNSKYFDWMPCVPHTENDDLAFFSWLSLVTQPILKFTVLENSSKLLSLARASGCTIIHAPISFEPGHDEISESCYGILAGVKEGSAFTKGEWGSDFAGTWTS